MQRHLPATQRMKRITLGLLVVLAVLLGLFAVLLGYSALTSKSPEATLARRIAATYSFADWYGAVALHNGLPDVYLLEGTIAVVPFHKSPPIAARVCSDIASMTHDPDPGASLNLTSVVLNVNGTVVAECYTRDGAPVPTPPPIRP